MIPFSPFSNIQGGFVGRDRSALEKRGLKPEAFTQLKQIHSDRIWVIESAEEAKTLQGKEGDALVTTIPGVPIAVRAADCVPILIAHPMGIVAAVHAGWRGTKEKILQKTLLRIQQQFKADPAEIVLKMGPSICERCYEVGEELAEAFGRGWGGDVIHPGRGGKYLLDLKFANQLLAVAAGVRLKNIEAVRECTLCREKDFFSYRGAQKRGEKGEERNYAWIMRML